MKEDRAFGLAGWVGQSLGMNAAHRHVDLEINYVLAGTMTYLVGGRVVTLPPRCLCLLWGGVPHQMIRGAGAVEAIWVTVPLTTVLRWGMPESFLRPLLSGGFLADVAPRPGDLDQLQLWLTDLPGRAGSRSNPDRNPDADSGDARRIVLLEIEARLRRFARELSRPSPTEGASHYDSATTTTPKPRDRGLDAVEAMAGYIARHFREAMGVADIAEAAHLHPNYAMTLFRSRTGMTLSRYLVLQRVAHAQRLLVTTEDSIIAIALDSGFGSVSRFYEAFRQQTGTTPRGFRAQIEP